VKKIGLVVNIGIPDAVKTSIDVIDFLRNRIDLTITPELSEKLKDKLDLESINIIKLQKFSDENLDIMIAIGGDGTILHTLHMCNLPIFGINAGVVGFLTEVQKENAILSLERVLKQDFKLDKRVRLKTKLNDEILEPATNEVVIHTDEIAKMRLYNILVDGVQAQTVRADGIIIATPTGSTSYALSAGGPILDPKVDAFLIVPIAPFKLSARPLVVSSNSTISISLLGSRRSSIVVIDGQAEYQFKGDDILNITRSDIYAEFVRFHPNFYRLIEEKLTTQ
jgi:NAD+ kinase